MNEDAYKQHNKPETGARPGVYTHPDVPGEELHASTFGAADAFVRQGWVYSKSLPSRTERLKAEKAAQKSTNKAKKTNKAKESN